jgi:hypothetical protein
MISAFVKIRLLQAYRAAKGLGFFRTLFVIGLLVFFAFGIFMQTEELPNAYYVSGIYLIMIAMLQVRRLDKWFLKIHFSNYKIVLLTEYLLLLIPLFFCLVYYFQWITLFAVVISSIIVVNLDFKPRHNSLNTMIQRLIPADCYEWKAGIRKRLIYILPLWVLGMAASFFVGVVPVILFLLGMLPLSFNEKNEPLQMILSYEKDANAFLFHKIKMQLMLFSIVAIPMVIAFLIFHSELWYLPLIEYFIFVTIHIYIILTKYAFYQPNLKSGNVQIFEAIGSLGIFIPFMLPVVWLLAIRFYFKSRKNLNLYLHDYH